MAGNTLEELFKGVGLEQGTVKAERHGRTAGSIIDKIENKCKADIEVLDEAIKKASGVIPTTIKSKTGKEYKPRFMWGAAGGGRRQINFMIDNHRLTTDKRFSRQCDQDAKSVRDALTKILAALGKMNSDQKRYL